jgi:heme exporter protein D
VFVMLGTGLHLLRLIVMRGDEVQERRKRLERKERKARRALEGQQGRELGPGATDEE